MKIGDTVCDYRRNPGHYTYGLVTGRSYGDRVMVLWPGGLEEDEDPYYLVVVASAANNNNPV